ncbi:hypothetical protein LX15_006209 [Streptoalloteichus tenebrarius]|uniref:Uncharacterized protein n=1 Tax=Streptoalloteichus tenebrarius (strain ATCC 17920 / DSM 40477 / JCM 4838 / CBS 697.72 / NBRC 16177 / NCIMB 11028 / NRRL B-12390 / A12253. 1 / ISP 5477) TaxID=1933 RepID=A0ABT1I3V6_STRSD|nr:hypothetical protein [Streptoalloteichus tenebrarius]MCP2262470.1 hypothetical protein [Streptoalloteichus tenebrarius]BFF01344.1 hypothetical protein GCM10020241_30190 [Streptoalloteichus tenebrarius]
MPDNNPTTNGQTDLLTSMMATLRTWVNDGSGGVHQASFTVDPDQLPTLRAGLEAARDKLLDMRQDADFLQSIPAPGNEEVSRRAVENLTERAKDTEGGLSRAINDGIDRLQDIIDQIDAMSATYRRADDNSRM